MRVYVTFDVEYESSVVHSKAQLEEMAQFVAQVLAEKYYERVIGDVDVDVIEIPTYDG